MRVLIALFGLLDTAHELDVWAVVTSMLRFARPLYVRHNMSFGDKSKDESSCTLCQTPVIFNGCGDGTSVRRCVIVVSPTRQ